MSVLLINCGSSKFPLLESFFSKNKISHSSYLMRENWQNSLNQYDAIVSSGAPILLTKEGADQYLPLFSVLKTFEKPFLGICFSHQILGLLYGATVKLDREDRQTATINTLTSTPLFAGLGNHFQMQEDHCESISVPEKFHHLASSKKCVTEAIKHPTLPYYGVQFHPESSGKSGEFLLNNFVEITKNLRSI